MPPTALRLMWCEIGYGNVLIYDTKTSAFLNAMKDY